MEPNFQTSFIPKKPIVESRAKPVRSVGPFMFFAIAVFIIAVLVFLGFFFYKNSLMNSISVMNEELKKQNNRFQANTLADLQLLDKRLKASSELLDQHISVSRIFEELEKVTLKTVRYTNFSYDLDDLGKSLVDIKMKGQTTSYKDVALQADLFAQNEYFVEPVFSNLSANEKNEVLFDLDFKVNRSSVDFAQMILLESKSKDAVIPEIINKAPTTQEERERMINELIMQSEDVTPEEKENPPQSVEEGGEIDPKNIINQSNTRP